MTLFFCLIDSYLLIRLLFKFLNQKQEKKIDREFWVNLNIESILGQRPTKNEKRNDIIIAKELKQLPMYNHLP